MPQTIIGCDLSRSWLDVHALPEGKAFQIANTLSAITAWLADLGPDTLVVFEATSGCDRGLIEALSAANIAYVRVNPRQAREFARATGVLAKTDRVDARLLAQMGRTLDLEATAAPSPERVRLADLLRRRNQLVEMRKAEKVRRHDAGQPDILADIEAMIAHLTRRIQALDKQISTLIAKSPELADQARLLSSVPGIGPTVLATLLGELPELGTRCRRRIASLAGLAPHARESGTWRGKRRIWGGRRKIREALYMAALTAVRRIPQLAAMRERMKAAGKAPKTILIAAARQLLVILNAIMRSKQPIRIA